MKSTETIGDLFNIEFDDFKPSLSLKELEMIDKEQTKIKFYKFNIYQFNMYYALVILSGFLLTLGCACHYLYTQNHIVKSNYQTITNNKPIVNKQIDNKIMRPTIVSIASKTSKHNKIKSSDKFITKPALITEQNKSQLIIIEKAIDIKKDSISAVPVEIKTIHKKMFIMKRDTIYKNDTLKVKPK